MDLKKKVFVPDLPPRRRTDLGCDCCAAVYRGACASAPRLCTRSPMGCKSSKLAEIRLEREELEKANKKAKELEAARRTRAAEFVSKQDEKRSRQDAGGSSSPMASSTTSSSKTDSLSQAVAEAEHGENSPHEKLLAKFAAKEAGATQAGQSKVVAPQAVSPEIVPEVADRPRRSRSSKERFTESIAAAHALGGSPAPSEVGSPAQPEPPSPTPVRDVMASMSRAARKFEENNQMPLEQELVAVKHPPTPITHTHIHIYCRPDRTRNTNYGTGARRADALARVQAPRPGVPGAVRYREPQPQRQ